MSIKGESKYDLYNETVKEIYEQNNKTTNSTFIAREVARIHPEAKIAVDWYRKHIKKYLQDNNMTGPEVKEYTRLEDECDNANINTNDVKHAWIKDDGISIFMKNPNFQEEDREALFKNLIEELKDYSPNFVKIKREKSKDSYCLVISPADIHVGKLALEIETGEAYNNQIAVQRALDGVKGILNKAQGYSFDKIVFVGGNDILHIDSPRRTTTSGTPQDTDGMWYECFNIAKQLYIDILEILITEADVHFVYNPSNHDYTSGFFLADVIKTYFRSCKNITFDTSIAHRKYFKYHNNLIGTTHGDGAKPADLPLLMAHESDDWGKTKHRYIYTHHVHHKVAKDHIGVTVESLRSPSGTDSWHSRNGYTGAPKAVEGFIHCKKNGQIARLTHIFS